MTDNRSSPSDQQLPHVSPSSIPTSVSHLLFPSSQISTVSSTLASLKRSTLSPHNRLRSIQLDAQFVGAVAERYGLPCIANERCGSWYIPPQTKAGSAYFKSTDGHYGQWSFSTRRLNLHVLKLIGEAGGWVSPRALPLPPGASSSRRPGWLTTPEICRCIIVDSTRRGKSMPDALSKTVPTWCAVLNRLLFSDQPGLHKIFLPKDVVGESEQAQIETRLHGFAKDAESLGLDKAALRESVRKPLRPFWVTPECVGTAVPDESSEYNRVVCCTASRRVRGAEMSEDGYVQGAGDDSEGWSRGLTPALFWKHFEKLLQMSEEEISDFVRLIRSDQGQVASDQSLPVEIQTSGLYIGASSNLKDKAPYDALVICNSPLPILEVQDRCVKVLHLNLGTGKLASRALRVHFPTVTSFLQQTLAPMPAHSPKILIAGDDRKDICIGLALAIYCMFYDEDNNFKSPGTDVGIDKTFIRRRLAAITACIPEANPSRTTLQSVHAFLMPNHV